MIATINIMCNTFKTWYIVFVKPGDLVVYKKSLLGIYLYKRFEPLYETIEDPFNGEFSNYKNVILLVKDLKGIVALDQEIQSL